VERLREQWDGMSRQNYFGICVHHVRRRANQKSKLKISEIAKSKNRQTEKSRLEIYNISDAKEVPQFSRLLTVILADFKTMRLPRCSSRVPLTTQSAMNVCTGSIFLSPLLSSSMKRLI
jgi:hypothetical protein